LKITFLGTGTSQGVPVIGCNCPVCTSTDARDKRLRTSILIEKNGHTLAIDSGPDFRQQMLNAHVSKLTAVIFTHEHKDHVAGLDDVRAFNFIEKKPVDVYAEKRVQKAIKREFAYIFAVYTYPGIPKINMHRIHNEPFNIKGIDIIPVRLMHYRLPILGFRIDNFAYLTDVKTIPPGEMEKLKDLECLVITALRKEPHISHMNVDEALKAIKMINPGKAYLIHMSHRFGLHAEMESSLPANVHIAYDGLVLNF
jgi:phosphoribosyl 1,2-cyclic phosphate phosphodiesterase